MLDVHPPHEAAHTWKDFFIHVGTICVGLLIAIGLEQTVEAMHRHHEQEKLRAALNVESRQILFDTQQVETGETMSLAWCRQVESQVSDAARDHHPIDRLVKRGSHPWDVPDNPVYTTAKSSAKLDLLSDDEMAGYGELDSILYRVALHYRELTAARRAFYTFLSGLDFALPNGVTPLATASPADLRQLHTVTIQLEAATQEFRYWSRQARGAVTALLAGERDLRKIETAERQFDNVP